MKNARRKAAIVVLGDGGWGTALARLLCDNGHACTLWGPFPDHIEEMRRRGTNVRFLPGVPLPRSLELTGDLREALAGAELAILASPVPYLRALLERVAGLSMVDSPLFVNVAKGIEVATRQRVSEMVHEILGAVRYAVLSGPSHAEEVARNVPTAVVAAAGAEEDARRVQGVFMNESFRVYTTDDVVGVELGGALKNVLALAAGICDGMGLGDNSKAALMTRGIAEMARLGQALGGRPETFSGLSGVGDLIVTCISRHSRNRHVGEELGRGRTLEEIQQEMGLVVAEGVKTARSAHALARRTGVAAPIIDQVYAALYEDKPPDQAVRELMTRAAKPERPHSAPTPAEGEEKRPGMPEDA
ncbi:MAG: NAD(P)-dependent glycerol-3-phosphate dehydrogenase [Kiritimatiellaeota bacterium]|nr:NAD(P)-dependent glycerol-3-phosphate dehydrogenase [Kiritimatiellota bacterium]